MSLLALLAAGAGTVIPPDPDPVDPEPPYALPTAHPWNVPEYATTPTPDGSGSVVHPGVWDFGPGQRWNGYRYWMANTPYADEAIALENPCIWGSNDGATWEVPEGVTNPLYPYPGGVTYFSDTDLYYDSAADQLVLHWRESNEKTWRARSSDGITWPAVPDLAVDAAAASGDPNPNNVFLSSSLVKGHDGTWRLYGGNGSSNGFYSAASIDGPWTTWTECNSFNNWHSHIFYDPADGLYRAIRNGAFVLTSTDGIIWRSRGTPILVKGGWELTTDNYYRCAIRPYDATHYSLWYTIKDAATGQHRVAYTRVLKSEWPPPPV